MRKKLLSILLVFATIIPFASQSVHSYVGDYKDGDLYYNVVDGKVVITDCSEDAVDVVIPATINGYPTTEIGQGAFKNHYNVKSLELPNTIEIINDDSFYLCYNLEHINIPTSVVEIGTCAFYSCSKLTNIVLPESITIIRARAFSTCRGLLCISIPPYVTEIEGGAFQLCENLKTIIIPTSVVRIGSYAFERCTSLNDIYYCGTENEWSNIYMPDNSEINGKVRYGYNGEIIPEILSATKIRKDGNGYEFDIKMSGITKDCKLIAVLYNDGILAGLKVTDIYEGCDSEIVTVSAEAANFAKIFVWDSLSGMRPLTEETFTYSLNK